MPRLLVVDDRDSDRRKIARLLRELPNLTVEEAADGPAALAALDDPPDVILTDLEVPGLDALELVTAVGERCPLVPVVLMTRRSEKEVALKALKAGASSFVLKSELRGMLLITVRQMLEIAGEKRRENRLARCHTRQHRVLDLPSDPDIIAPAVRLARRMLEETAAPPVGPGEARCPEDDEISFTDTERVRVGVALEEAIANAVYHGNLEMDSAMRDDNESRYYALARERSMMKPYRDRRVHVELTVARTGDPRHPGADHPDEMNADPPGPNLRFFVEDEGAGFDPASLPDPTDPENLLKAHGRGLLLVRTFMDQVTHNERGNAVTMVKTAGGKPPS